MPVVDAGLAARARRMGPLPYSCLGAGPPGPVPEGLGTWLAGEIDRTWDALGRPDPLVVVDGDGRRGATPSPAACRAAPALRWLFVGGAPESPGIALEDAVAVLGPAVAGDADEGPVPVPGIGPLAAAVADLPAGLDVAVVVAVDLLGRLPADVFEWRDGRWWEVRLSARASGDVLDDLLVAADARSTPVGEEPPGTRVRDAVAARRWVSRARAVASSGVVLAVEVADAHPVADGGPGATSGVRPARVDRLTGDLSSLVAMAWTMTGR